MNKNWGDKLLDDLKVIVKMLFWVYLFVTPMAFGNLIWAWLSNDFTNFIFYSSLAFAGGLLIIRLLKTYWADK